MSKKIYFAPNVYILDKSLFSDFQISEDWMDCDIAIFQSTIEPNIGSNNIPLNKIIYLSLEPPIAGHRLDCYRDKDKFFLYVGWDSEDTGNQLLLSEQPQYFPWQIVPWGYEVKDNNYQLNTRGVFMMNMVNAYEDVPDCYGAVNITKLRRIFGTYIHDNIPNSVVIGKGWPWSNVRTCSDGNWQIDKQVQIEKSNCDFVVALENVIMKNHITEKIKDGLISGKVTLYLGCPNIEEFIPTNCFVDLRKWYNPQTKELDLEDIGSYLLNMTQEEYSDIIKNAKEFIKGNSNYHSNLNQLTTKIRNYIKTHE